MQLFLNYLTASANRACAAVAAAAAFATSLGDGCSAISDAAATHTSAGAATTLALVKTSSNRFNE